MRFRLVQSWDFYEILVCDSFSRNERLKNKINTDTEIRKK